MLIDAILLICINIGCIYWLCVLPCIQANGTLAAAVRSLEIRNDICLQLADFKKSRLWIRDKQHFHSIYSLLS